jgi:acetyltransferase
MHSLFNAQSVVVVGVSESEDNLGKNIIGNLLNFGYKGKIYAVGSRGGEVLGHRIYGSVADVPETVDLAVLLTPARFIPEILTQCGKKGILRAIVESGGFGELGPERETLDRALLDVCRQYAIRFVGPNCLGVVNVATGLYTSFLPLPAPFRRGKVSVIAQSGGLGISLGQKLTSTGIGLNKLVSIGNKLNLHETDFLTYLINDPDTEIIYLYLEDFKDGRAFAEAAQRSAKPIVLHKSNTSPLSATIARSHTGALAADDTIVDAVCRETGIVRVVSVSDAVNAIKGFSMPPLRGINLAVVSRSGGHAVVAADTCVRYGFSLPPFNEAILEEVRSRLRAGVIRLGNPLDLGDIFEIPSYRNIVEAVLMQDNIHGVIFIQVSRMPLEREKSKRLQEALWHISLQYGKPIAIVDEISGSESFLLQETGGFPLFSESLEAVQALAVQNIYHSRTITGERDAAPSAVAGYGSKDVQAWIGSFEKRSLQPQLHDSLALLECAGIPVPPWSMTTDLGSALKAAERVGYPVALKAVASSLSHKTEKGAVALNVGEANVLESEWQRLNRIAGDLSGIIVQKMVLASREIIVGGKRDVSFGPVVLVGLGGINAEVLRDVSIRLAPISMDAAFAMIQSLSGASLLGRFRGKNAADLQMLASIIVRVSRLMHELPRIRELDINPIVLNDSGKGGFALDARILVDVAS